MLYLLLLQWSIKYWQNFKMINKEIVVQKLMGHTDIQVTLNTYTSVFDKFKEKEIDKVNKYYLEENMLNAVKLLKEQHTKDSDNEMEL